MDTKSFGQWIAGLSSLTVAQRQRVESALKSAEGLSGVVAVLEERGVQECPYCGGAHPLRNGHASGLQRYRCHGCHKSFNVLTGTPLARLRKKELWSAFVARMVEGLSVRKAAAAVGVHPNTSFRWRHRILKTPATMQATKLSGVVEADETLFRTSRKGARQLGRKARKRGGGARPGRGEDHTCVLVARDRTGYTVSCKLDTFDAATLKTILKPRIERDSLLCTDGAPVYAAFAAQVELTHEPINLEQGIRVRQRVFHVQNVNNYDRRLKTWIARFNGVATKYLDHYLGWFRLLDVDSQMPPLLFLHAAMGRPTHYLTVT